MTTHSPTPESAGSLSEARRLLLEQRLAGRARDDPAGTGIPRRGADEVPLSPAQHGVWLAEQLSSHEALFGVRRGLWLRGDLDCMALQRAFTRLVRRHEVLRTTFRFTDGEPVQVIGSAENVSAALDLSVAIGVTPEQRRAEAVRLARSFSARPFDIAAGPLFSGLLLAVDRDEHLLALRVHHLVTDEWSGTVFTRDLESLYAAELHGHEAELPPLEVRFGDVAAWLAEPAQVRKRDTQLEYWREVLSGVPSGIELPTDKTRPDAPSHVGAVERLTLPTDVASAVRKLAADHGVTLFSALLALFGAALHRYSGQGRFAVGSLLSGRSWPETEQLLGMFANTVAIPLDFGDSPTFAQALTSVGRSVVSALDHQDVPFDQVVGALRLPRDSARNPLFQVLFQCIESREHKWRLDRVECEPISFDTDVAKVDLALMAVNTPTVIDLELTYATDLYEGEAVRRLLGHLSRLIEAAAADPSQSVAEIDILLAEERDRAVRVWNATTMQYPADATVHGLVERWACEAPGRTALRLVDGTPVPYRELNERANRLARHLRGMGVRQESLVGVCLDHSLEMFVALLAVLKAGAAYVPLDPSLPSERLSWILADTDAPVVITTRELRRAVPDAFSGQVLCADGDWAEISEHPATDLEPVADADNLLYVIYTSGSTGRPKGVLVPHRGVVNYLWWAIDGYGLEGERGAPMVGSIAFDLSVPNFWLPLIGGKCVTLLSPDRDLESLAAALGRSDDYSLLKITPGHLDVLRSMLEPGSVSSVRTFVVGADEVRPETIAGWHAVAPAARIINEYGPTETVVGCSIYTVPENFDTSGPVSIGKPIGNLRMYVLDRGLNPAPVGVVGELYIGGAGVARGYLHRPALTAEKFVPDPFAGPGERLYRTGDLARYRPDGDLEFLGRTDFQVKIRGYRIELGEVEARMGLHPQVAEAVVAAPEGRTGHRRLVGYIVPIDRTTPPTTAEIRAFLAQTLPDYMVPSQLIVLDAMPLTAAGKVDRTALPTPQGRNVDRQEPGSEDESLLAAIWAEVLGIPQVGVRDNFFDCGGDSIMAIKVAVRAREAGLSLTPTSIFRHQTVAELISSVKRLDTLRRDSEQSAVTGEVVRWPARTEPADLNTPCGDAHQTRRITYAAPPDVDRMRSSLRALLNHHGALRLRTEPEDDRGLRPYLAEPDDSDPLRVVDLTGLSERDVAQARDTVIADARATLDLTTGPLLRAVLFLGDPPVLAELVIVVHAAVVDEASWAILLADLECSYDGRKLPPPTAPYIEWQDHVAGRIGRHEAVEGTDHRTTQARLAEIPPLPTDAPGGGHPGTDLVTFRLSKPETATLAHRVAPAHEADLDAILLACLVRAVGQVLGGTEVAVDVERDGRRESVEGMDLSRTIGSFTCVYALPLQADHEGPLTSLASVNGWLRDLPRPVRVGGRQLSSRGDTAGHVGGTRVRFSYLGARVDDAHPASRAAVELAADCPYLLDVEAITTGGELAVHWRLPSGSYENATVEELIAAFRGALGALVRDADTRVSEPAPETSGLAEVPLSVRRVLAESRDLADVADAYRLTPLQTGMLFQTIAAPEQGDYIARFEFTINGPLDSGALRSAWQFVLDRHDALRTSFAWRRLPYPVQLVHQHVELPWEERDGFPGGGAPAGGSSDGQRHGLPLEGGLPLGFELVRMGPDRHQLVWRFHHTLLDGWSLPILMDEVLIAYRSLTDQEPLPQLAKPVQFREHVAWLEARDEEAEATYWRSALAGFAEPTPISVIGREANQSDMPDAAVETVRAAYSKSRTSRLRDFARQHRVTVGTVLHAAWALLLARDSGRRDVVFGTTSSGRSSLIPGVDRMVGMLMNTVPARVQILDQPVGDWLRGLHDTLTSLREHEHSAMADVQRASQVPAGIPLFESILVYDNFAGIESATVNGVTFSLDQVHQRTGYPLVMNIGLHDEGHFALTFDAWRVDDRSAARFLDAFRMTLEELLDPETRLVDLLPETSSGRTGRIPAPHTEAAQLSEPRTSRTEVERVLAGLWSEILGLPEVGVDDDFFALGGDSILAMQVVAQARDHGIRLRPRDLFACPTVAGLAAVVDGSVAVSVHADQSVVTGD
ncbi:amino acid adenylation domain-containing protein, partial [Streptomyces sp. NPDC023998]|uniref:amino acid adenylation domain-containing protein n=1 Tax=Streptomyces sp. NPDC023998 TaxID=3154597 RepID=UPI0033D3E52E